MQEKELPANWKVNAGFFIAGQFLSMFGSMMVQHAIMWHITLREQSGSLMAVFTCAALLPMVLVSPFAGVWADRYNRKYLVNISDGAIALVTLAVAVLFFFGVRSVWILLLAVMARSIGQGVQQPAASALIPQIVPAAHLARFNGLQSTSQSITMLAAPMAGGALLTFLPIQYVFSIDVITAAIGIIIVFFCVRVSPAGASGRRGPAAKSYLHEMAESLRFIAGTPWLKTLFAAFAMFSVLVSPSALMTPLQVTRSFGADVWRLTSVEIAFSTGMMAGGIVITAWGGLKNKTHTMALALMLFGVSTFLFGVVNNFWIYLAVMAFCGCTMPVFNTPCMTILQTNIPPEMMGRVFSAISAISGLSMPIGMALFGPLADAVKIEWILIATGSLLAAGSFILRGRGELVKIGAGEGA